MVVKIVKSGLRPTIVRPSVRETRVLNMRALPHEDTSRTLRPLFTVLR
jgi:hypothetical protein